MNRCEGYYLYKGNSAPACASKEINLLFTTLCSTVAFIRKED